MAPPGTVADDRIAVEPFSSACTQTAIVVDCAADKSLTHRAVMFAAMAKGVTTIANPLLGADCRSTMSCFERLGVTIGSEQTESGPALTVRSGGISSFQTPTEPLDCGNSGTTARLITGLLAAVPGLDVTLAGDESLSKRPMGRVVDPLRAMGADISGPSGGEYLPLKIIGKKLAPAHHVVSKATAQVKSALLLAAMQTPGRTTVTLPAGSRDHTEQILKKLGATITVSRDSEGREVVVFEGPFEPAAQDVAIPVDPSSAAFFGVLGLLRPTGELIIPSVLDNPTRTGFLKVLARMSSGVVTVGQPQGPFIEPVMELRVQGGAGLTPTDISAHEVPTLVDEIPILAVAAMFATGDSRFHNLGELRVKESDRLTKTAELLTRAGGEARVVGDDLLIKGGATSATAFDYDPEGDHRLAMAAAVLAKKATGPCRIKGPDCVAVSFPGFFELLEKASN